MGPKLTSPAKPNSRSQAHREHAEVVRGGEHAEKIGRKPPRPRSRDNRAQRRRSRNPRERRSRIMSQRRPSRPLRPHVNHQHQQHQGRDRPQCRRNQVGSDGFEVAHDVGRDQRAGDAAEPTQHHDRERARGERVRHSPTRRRGRRQAARRRSRRARRRSSTRADRCCDSSKPSNVRPRGLIEAASSALPARVRLTSSHSRPITTQQITAIRISLVGVRTPQD